MHKELFAGIVFFFLIPTSALGAQLAPCGAVTGNLLQNCGFETGDFAGWTQSGNTDSTFVVGDFDGFLPNSGTQLAALGPSGSDGFLSQTVTTIPDDFYAISWYLASDGGTPNKFNATWDGNSIFSGTNIAVPDFVLYSFTQVATTASTTISFGFSSEPGFLALDDTSVVDTSVPNDVPEPGSIVLIGAGVTALLLRHRREAGLEKSTTRTSL